MAYSKAFLLLSLIFVFALLISSEVSARQLNDQTHEKSFQETLASQSQPITDGTKNPNKPACGKGKGNPSHPIGCHGNKPGPGRGPGHGDAVVNSQTDAETNGN